MINVNRNLSPDAPLHIAEGTAQQSGALTTGLITIDCRDNPR